MKTIIEFLKAFYSTVIESRQAQAEAALRDQNRFWD